MPTTEKLSRGGVCESRTRKESIYKGEDYVADYPHESHAHLDFSLPIQMERLVFVCREKFTTQEERQKWLNSIKRMRIGVCIHCRCLFRPEEDR